MPMSGLTKKMTSGLRLAIECRLMLRARCTFICSIIRGPVKTPSSQVPKGRRDKWLSVSSVHISKCMASLQAPSALQVSATNFKVHAGILALLASSPTLNSAYRLSLPQLLIHFITLLFQLCSLPLSFCFPPSPLISHLPTLFLFLSWQGQVCRSCSVHNFISLLWTLPDASGCSLSYICNKTFL